MAMIIPRQIARNLGGHFTEILIQKFADRILVLVTQMGKVGTLIQVSIPDTTPLPPALEPNTSRPNQQPLPPPPAAIQLTALLGGAPSEHMQTLHALYAAQIATLLWVHESRGPLEVARRTVVVGLALNKSGDAYDIGLTEHEKTVFQGVMSMLYDVLNRN